jgi:hypothetical protein
MRVWSRLGGTMVSVLDIRPKVCEFKPGRGDEFSRAIKFVARLPCRGSKAVGPVSQGSTVCKMSLARMNKNTSTPSHHPLRPCLLLATKLLYDCQGAWVDESVFLCRQHSTVALYACISCGGCTRGQLVAAVQRRSLTSSTWSCGRQD